MIEILEYDDKVPYKQRSIGLESSICGDQDSVDAYLDD
jgi:hypothetical protein